MDVAPFFGFPALVAGQALLSDEEAIALIQRRLAPGDPGSDIGYWYVQMSSKALDAYHTHMDTTSLRNFVADAQAGVTVLDSHNSAQLGMGASFWASFDEATGKAFAGLYTPRGLRLNPPFSYPDTDELLKAVMKGIVREVSVGFYGGTFTCDVCGRSLWDWECSHIPGLPYEDEFGRGVASAGIFDARLAEISMVSKGASPGATIQKAVQLNQLGRLTSGDRSYLEDAFRTKLTGKEVMLMSGRLIAKDQEPELTRAPEDMEEPDESAEEESAEDGDVLRQILDEEAGTLDLPEGTAEEQIRWIVQQLAKVKALVDGDGTPAEEVESAVEENRKLLAEAEDGRAYRALLFRRISAAASIVHPGLTESDLQRMVQLWTRQMMESYAAELERLQSSTGSTVSATPSEPPTVSPEAIRQPTQARLFRT